MAETAAYLVDNIIPHVKIRQYVLSVPIPLRYWMASNKKLLAKVHKIFALSIEEFYTGQNTNTSRSGSICFVQRFGGALNLNVHFHLLQIEGVYEPRSTAVPKFKKTKPPSDLDIKNLVTIIREKIIKHLRRSGYIKDLPPDEDPTDLFDEEPTYAGLMSASVEHQIALGERQGQKVRFIGSGFGYEGDLPELKGRLCAYLGGFSLHAAISIPRYRRDELEKLIRYTARPSISTERMSLTKTGDIKYELKKTWKNGVTHVVLSPHELIEKLCALIPQPRMHLVRYSGVLAPNAKMRPHVIPGLTRAQIKAKEEKNKDPDKSPSLKKSSWAKLLARVFEIDISKCVHCNGKMKIIASIKDPPVIKRILTHLGLSPIPPPLAPARIRELFVSM